MARRILTGDKELEATLQGLADKPADKIARSALGAGASVVASAMRKAAPVGKTGAVKKSIGKRSEKNKRNGAFSAKAGINVGKQKQTAEQSRRILKAPHAHLVALGTGPRIRDTIGGKFSYITRPTDAQLSTGTMPSNPFIRSAYTQSQGKAAIRMRARAAKALAKELLKLNK